MIYKISPFFISGNSMPQKLIDAATVQIEDSFMIYGGFNGSSIVDKIYKYNKDGGQWEEMPTTMSEPKEGMTAIKIRPSIFNKC